MIWLRTKKVSTRELLRSEHHAHTIQRAPLRYWVALALLLVCVAAGSSYLTRHLLRSDATQHLESITAENLQLKELLEKDELKMQQEQATREELMHQLEKASADIKNLQSELAFFKKRKDTPTNK